MPEESPGSQIYDAQEQLDRETPLRQASGALSRICRLGALSGASNIPRKRKSTGVVDGRTESS